MGNICRSPMAEGIFLSILKKEGLTSKFSIDSAGTLGYHQGELPDSRMRFHAEKRGYKLTHISRKFTRMDFENFDWIIAMDDSNFEDINDLVVNNEDKSKIHRMVDFCKELEATHIPDPYYGGDKGFDNVIDLLEDACQGLFEKIYKK
jgi:protein-tyrosine phosphatase